MGESSEETAHDLWSCECGLVPSDANLQSRRPWAFVFTIEVSELSDLS